MTLQERFTFYRQRNAAPLAYFFARVHYVTTFCDRNSRPQQYVIPNFLVVANCTGSDHGKVAA